MIGLANNDDDEDEGRETEEARERAGSVDVWGIEYRRSRSEDLYPIEILKEGFFLFFLRSP